MTVFGCAVIDFFRSFFWGLPFSLFSRSISTVSLYFAIWKFQEARERERFGLESQGSNLELSSLNGIINQVSRAGTSSRSPTVFTVSNLPQNEIFFILSFQFAWDYFHFTNTCYNINRIYNAWRKYTFISSLFLFFSLFFLFFPLSLSLSLSLINPWSFSFECCGYCFLFFFSCFLFSFTVTIF